MLLPFLRTHAPEVDAVIRSSGMDVTSAFYACQFILAEGNLRGTYDDRFRVLSRPWDDIGALFHKILGYSFRPDENPQLMSAVKIFQLLVQSYEKPAPWSTLLGHLPPQFFVACGFESRDKYLMAVLDSLYPMLHPGSLSNSHIPTLTCHSAFFTALDNLVAFSADVESVTKSPFSIRHLPFPIDFAVLSPHMLFEICWSAMNKQLPPKVIGGVRNYFNRLLAPRPILPGSGDLKTQEGISPELCFACEHWVDCQSVLYEDDERAGRMAELLSKRGLQWVEVLVSLHIDPAATLSTIDISKVCNQPYHTEIVNSQLILNFDRFGTPHFEKP